MTNGERQAIVHLASKVMRTLKMCIQFVLLQKNYYAGNDEVILMSVSSLVLTDMCLCLLFEGEELNNKVSYLPH